VSGHLLDLATFPRKETWYPLNRRLGEPQRQSGHGGEEKNSWPLPGIKPQSFSLQHSHYTD